MSVLEATLSLEARVLHVRIGHLTVPWMLFAFIDRPYDRL